MEDARVVVRGLDEEERSDDKPVSKAEFVGLMVALGMYDRARYEMLCKAGRLWAIPLSDNPN